MSEARGKPMQAALPGPTERLGIELAAPEPAQIVTPAEAERLVPVAPDVADRIEKLVTAFVASIVAMDSHSDEYRRAVGEMSTIGEREIVATSQMSSRLLSRPVRAMNGTLDGGSPVARSLLELRHTVEDLNPARYDLTARNPRKLLGIFPVGDPVRAYFERYGRAEGRIQGVVRALSEARAELQRDNAAIGQEQRSLWTEMETLRQYAYMAQRLDEALDARIDEMTAADPSRARALREDMLFPVRQRRQDISTHLAVATQGYAALRVVEENNHEVIRAIETATTTTVAALRTAVMVAQALTNQRKVVDQLAAINAATSGMLEATPGRRSAPPSDVGQAPAAGTGASGPGVDLAALQRAWDDVFAALDQIDAYKTTALEAMMATVEQLSSQVERSRESIEHRPLQDGAPAGAVASPSSSSSELSIR